ncbi:MAG: protein translocase subunit SecF [Patescibacteria group bacterium]|nr:protein translocase subunit SecF [Patescibacteria group bacterium]
MDIIGKKYLYFLLSLIVIIPGVISLLLFGLNLSIDFTGGTMITVSVPKQADQKAANSVAGILQKEGLRVSSTQTSSNLVLVRTQLMDQTQDKRFVSDLGNRIKGAKQEEFESIGPTIGAETTTNAILAVIIASLFIILYITWSFRKVPKPASSFRFGICAIIALVHDVLVVVGIFAILGHFFGVEVDSLFLTALLTVIGFSVHDTIVVFDRIRENLRRVSGLPFSKVVNESILQTLDRSLNTSLTVVLVLLALLLFGGDSIRWFVVALLVGVISGTYSSIFNASPLLVVWQELSDKFSKKK